MSDTTRSCDGCTTINPSNQSPVVSKEMLRALGDPSGRQDAGYWDEWFQIVSSKEGSTTGTTTTPSFEWYCRPEEVVRVLSYHHELSASDGKMMIHPGSGTSLVPRMLMEAFPNHRQVIVDISEVAVVQAKKSLGSSSNDRIEYLVADVLDPPLPFESSVFSCWVDKGLIDAVFAESNNDEEQAEKLFAEARRLLVEDGGLTLIISLAEDHSLRIVLENWLSQSSLGWSSDLHVWELEPVSGDLRPFGFVLTSSSSTSREEGLRVVWHFIDETSATFAVTSESAAESVRDQVTRSRRLFSEQKAKQNKARKVLACIEIKPDDTDVDLEAIADHIIAKKNWSLEDGCRDLQVSWHPFDSSDSPTLYLVIPIGYGISKLSMKCVVDPNDLEEMVSAMEGALCGVQSVDVDWHHTFPVSDTSDFLFKV